MIDNPSGDSAVSVFNFKMEIKNNLGIMEDCFRDCVLDLDDNTLTEG